MAHNADLARVKVWENVEIASGATLDINGTWKIGGTTVTVSAAEINALAATGLDATELGYLDGVVAGTSTASKAAVLGAFRNLDQLHVAKFYMGTNNGSELTSTITELNSLGSVTAGVVSASKAVVASADKDVGDFRNLDVVNLDAGASGTAGSVDIFPTTGTSGKWSLTCAAQTGNTTVETMADAMGQATTVHIADPGIATSYLLQSTAAVSVAEANVLDGATAGTVVASKAVVADADKDVGGFRNLSAGTATGGAGTVNIFPTTGTRGKWILSFTSQTGNTNVEMMCDAMGQATTIHFADPISATSYAAQSTAALTLAEVDVLDAVTPGTVAASKAVVVDGSLNIGDFNNLDAVNLDAGKGGTAGTVDVFPTTNTSGKWTLTCAAQTGDTVVETRVAQMGQATVLTVPDPGAGTANFVLTAGDQTVGGTKTLSSALKTSAGVGAVAGTGVAAVEYGDGILHKTALTLTNVSVPITRITPAETGFGAFKIYDPPAGRIYLLGTVAEITVTGGANVVSNGSGDYSIGSTATADATLDTTDIEYCAKTALTDPFVSSVGSGSGALAVPATFTGSDKDVYLNLIFDAGDCTARTSATTVVQGSVSDDEIQRFNLSTTVTGGTWEISFSGETTSSLAWNAAAADVTAALEALTAIGAGQVTTTAVTSASYWMTFVGTMAKTNVATMTMLDYLTPATIIPATVSGTVNLTWINFS